MNITPTLTPQVPGLDLTGSKFSQLTRQEAGSYCLLMAIVMSIAFNALSVVHLQPILL
jgi:hypothetical protein